MKINNLKINNRINPLSIDEKIPLFSYEVQSDKDGDFQIARRIQEEMVYPGQVKITVIRETRSVAFAK